MDNLSFGQLHHPAGVDVVVVTCGIPIINVILEVAILVDISKGVRFSTTSQSRECEPVGSRLWSNKFAIGMHTTANIDIDGVKGDWSIKVRTTCFPCRKDHF